MNKEIKRTLIAIVYGLLLVAFGLVMASYLVTAETFELNITLNGTELTIEGYNTSKTWNITGNITDTFSFDFELTNYTCEEMFNNLTICWERYRACSQSEADCQSWKVYWTDQYLYKENYTYCHDIELSQCNQEISRKQQTINEKENQHINLNNTYTNTLKDLETEKQKQFQYAILAFVIGGGATWAIIWGKKRKKKEVTGPVERDEYRKRF